MTKRIAALVCALLGSLAVPLLTPSAQQPGRPAGNFVPGELIVQFRPGFSEFQRNGALASLGAGRIRRFPEVGVEHVRLAPGQSVQAALAAFRRHPAVALAQPNFVRRLVASAPPDDTYWLFGFLWGTERIGAQAAWASYTMGGTGVVVASIDTGVDYTHPDLAANMWRNPDEIPGNGNDDDGNGYVDDVFGIDAIDHDTDPMDDQGHGSHTSGTMAGVGNNGQGIVGVAWDSRILACRFIDSSGSGRARFHRRVLDRKRLAACTRGHRERQHECVAAIQLPAGKHVANTSVHQPGAGVEQPADRDRGVREYWRLTA